MAAVITNMLKTKSAASDAHTVTALTPLLSLIHLQSHSKLKKASLCYQVLKKHLHNVDVSSDTEEQVRSELLASEPPTLVDIPDEWVF